MGESVGGSPHLGVMGTGEQGGLRQRWTALEEIPWPLHFPTHSRSWTESKLLTLCAAPLSPILPAPTQLRTPDMSCAPAPTSRP